MPHEVAFQTAASLLQGRRIRLLVVDDQPTNIQAIYQIFSGTYQVFMATSGEQALAFCKKSPPDLVLLDVVMPGMDGLQVCRTLKSQEDTQDIPVIFVTGGSREDEENACWAAGGVDFINKPINPNTLRQRVRAHLTLKLQTDLLRNMALVDGLCGIANRRSFDERLVMEFNRARRECSEFSLALADVDFFKRYNDHYGHQRGDDCLRQVATALKGALTRPGDLVARYGGEEFACILPATDVNGADNIGRLLIQAVQALNIPHADSAVAPMVTISMGIVVCLPQPDWTPAALLAYADQLLYRAKKAGRSRIELAHFDPSGTGL